MNNINTATVAYFDTLLEWMSGDFTREQLPKSCPVRTVSEAATVLWQNTEWSPETICRALSGVRWPGEEGWQHFHPSSAEWMIDSRLAVVVVDSKTSDRGLFLEGSCRVFGGMNTVPPGEGWKTFQEQAKRSALALAKHRKLSGNPKDWEVWLLVPQFF